MSVPTSCRLRADFVTASPRRAATSGVAHRHRRGRHRLKPVPVSATYGPILADDAGDTNATADGLRRDGPAGGVAGTADRARPRTPPRGRRRAPAGGAGRGEAAREARRPHRRRTGLSPAAT